MNQKILQEILPYKVTSNLIRLGNRHDGGYVIEEGALERVDALYTYGVGRNITFEKDFLTATNKPIFLFDHTIKFPGIQGMVFFKEGLSGIKKKGFNNFTSIVQHKNVLLKIDVEGDEAKWVENTNFEKLPVDTLILEFHNFPFDLRYIRKIQKHYNIVWVHGNNNGRNRRTTKKGVPVVLETTFVKKTNEIFDGSRFRKKFPLTIDSPNLKNKPDINLDFRPGML